MPPPVQTRGARAARAVLLGTLLTVATVACCAVTLLGWGRGFVAALQGSLRIVSPTSGPVTLVVEGDALRDLTVRPGDGPTVVATLLGTTDRRLRFEREGERLRLHLPDGVPAASLLIEAPRGSELDLALRSGTIEVGGMSGPLALDVDEGRVLVRDHAASGALSGRVGTGALDVSLRSLDDDGTVALESGVGNVTLEIPDGIGFAFEARGGAGRLDIAGVTISPREESALGGGFVLVGSAEPERGRAITLRSGRGDVLLRAR